MLNTSSDKVSVDYNWSLDLLNIERKHSVKNNGRPGRSVTGQSAGGPAGRSTPAGQPV